MTGRVRLDQRRSPAPPGNVPQGARGGLSGFQLVQHAQYVRLQQLVCCGVVIQLELAAHFRLLIFSHCEMKSLQWILAVSVMYRALLLKK